MAIPTLEEWRGTATDQAPARGAIGFAIGGMLALVLLGLGAVVLVPALMSMQTRTQLSITETNLKTLAGAMQAYHDTWGSFPPAVTYGPNGAPMHSWRVLLLPYLDQEPLYAQYNFREPWDSPNNRMLLAQMPAVFSASAPDGSEKTSFVVVTGDRTMFPNGTTTSRGDAVKGPNGTALIVESAYYQVEWTSPVDLSFDSMNFLVNDPNGSSISGTQPDGALVAKVDGTTEFLNTGVWTEPMVQMLLVRDAAPIGGVSLGPAVLYSGPVDPRRRYEQIDISAQANQLMDEDYHGGRPGNNLSTLPIGIQNLGGVEFQVGPKLLCLGLQEGTTAHLPGRIDGIPVHRTADRLHFLHATGYKTTDGTPIGHYEVHYADGSVEMVKIVYGVDVRDWWDGDSAQSVTDGRMVWLGQNPAIQGQNGVTQIRLFMSTWKNPRPGDEIASIDFVNYQATECTPFCVAITIDNPRDAAAPASDEPVSQEMGDTSSSAPAETAVPPAASAPATENIPETPTAAEEDAAVQEGADAAEAPASTKPAPAEQATTDSTEEKPAEAPPAEPPASE